MRRFFGVLGTDPGFQRQRQSYLIQYGNILVDNSRSNIRSFLAGRARIGIVFVGVYRRLQSGFKRYRRSVVKVISDLERVFVIGFVGQSDEQALHAVFFRITDLQISEHRQFDDGVAHHIAEQRGDTQVVYQRIQQRAGNGKGGLFRAQRDQQQLVVPAEIFQFHPVFGLCAGVLRRLVQTLQRAGVGGRFVSGVVGRCLFVGGNADDTVQINTGYQVP